MKGLKVAIHVTHVQLMRDSSTVYGNNGYNRLSVIDLMSV